jgi:hypothetical protein
MVYVINLKKPDFRHLTIDLRGNLGFWRGYNFHRYNLPAIYFITGKLQWHHRSSLRRVKSPAKI